MSVIKALKETSTTGLANIKVDMKMFDVRSKEYAMCLEDQVVYQTVLDLVESGNTVEALKYLKGNNINSQVKSEYMLAFS